MYAMTYQYSRNWNLWQQICYQQTVKLLVLQNKETLERNVENQDLFKKMFCITVLIPLI